MQTRCSVSGEHPNVPAGVIAEHYCDLLTASELTWNVLNALMIGADKAIEGSRLPAVCSVVTSVAAASSTI